MAELRGDAKARYVAAMFGRIARRYDLLNTAMTGGRHYRWRRLAARLASDGLAGAALDVATGTGDLAIALARRPGLQRVVALDFVPQMLAIGQAKVERVGLSGRVQFVQGDALALPFPDGAFACATSGFSLRNVADVPRVISEMARVVRPGGRVAVLEIVPLGRNGLFPWLVGLYFRRIVPLLGRVVARDREAYSYLPRSVEAFLTAEQLVWAMEEAGLRHVRSRSLAMGSVVVQVGEKA